MFMLFVYVDNLVKTKYWVVKPVKYQESIKVGWAEDQPNDNLRVYLSLLQLPPHHRQTTSVLADKLNILIGTDIRHLHRD